MVRSRSVEEIEKEIARDRENFQRQADQIKADRRLSPHGKHEALTRLKNEARERHRQRMKEHEEAVAAERASRYQRLFSYGSKLDTYRGLYAQVAAADKEGLQRLKKQAINTDDGLLKMAVYQVAVDFDHLDLLADAPEEIQEFIHFESKYGLRKIGMQDRRSIAARIGQSFRTSNQHVWGSASDHLKS